MPIRLNSCCCGCTTRTGCMVIAIFNLIVGIASFILMTVFLILIIVAANQSSINNDHAALIVAYVFLSIGIVSGLLQIIMASLLIRGVKQRNAKLVRIYLIFGSITMGMALISIAFGAFTISSFISALIGAIIQVYFLLVVYSEYKNILEESMGGNENPTMEPKMY